MLVTTERSGSNRPLGTAVDQAVYRILQEALTNAARHGGGKVRIGLAFGEDEIRLTVSNPVADRAYAAVGGHGLIEMDERATLLGGSLEAGRSNGQFIVTARIPYRTPVA